MQKLTPTYEIMGSLLSHDSDKDVAKLKEAPKDFIFAHYNVSLAATDVIIVVNEMDTVNLVLPYYESIEQAKISILDNTDLEDVQGGEVWVIALFITATVAGISGGVAVLGAGAGAYVKSKK